jgi:acyl-ACP thioesterase
MYSYKTRVAASQIGLDGLETIPSILTTMQDCSQFWLESEPVFAEYLKQNGLTMVITSRQADIVRFPAYGEVLEVATSIYESNRYFGYRNTVLIDEDATPVALSWVVGAFIDIAKGRLVSLPREVLDTITYDPRREMDYLDKRIALPTSPPQALPPFIAQYSDIDYNRHVNNVHYIRMARDYVPTNKSYTRIRVEYKAQARQGDTITPLVYDSPKGTTCVQLMLNGTTDPCAVVEFSQR